MADPLDIYKQWLSDNGLKYEIDSDGDIHFKYQTCNMYIINPKKDTQFLQVMLPNFWSIESEQEYLNALKVCNMVSMQRKVVKAFVTEKNTFLMVEMFIDNTPDLEDFMERVLDILIQGRMFCAEKMRELQ